MESFREIVRQEISANSRQSTESLDECINGEELCAYLGISKPTLIRWRNKGKIPFLKVGGVIRYNKQKVSKALESGNKKGGTK
jgi:excisionase family DNA binding protein